MLFYFVFSPLLGLHKVTQDGFSVYLLLKSYSNYYFSKHSDPPCIRIYQTLKLKPYLFHFYDSKYVGRTENPNLIGHIEVFFGSMNFH